MLISLHESLGIRAPISVVYYVESRLMTSERRYVYTLDLMFNPASRLDIEGCVSHIRLEQTRCSLGIFLRLIRAGRLRGCSTRLSD